MYEVKVVILICNANDESDLTMLRWEILKGAVGIHAYLDTLFIQRNVLDFGVLDFLGVKQDTSCIEEGAQYWYALCFVALECTTCLER